MIEFELEFIEQVTENKHFGSVAKPEQSKLKMD